MESDHGLVEPEEMLTLEDLMQRDREQLNRQGLRPEGGREERKEAAGDFNPLFASRPLDPHPDLL